MLYSTCAHFVKFRMQNFCRRVLKCNYRSFSSWGDESSKTLNDRNMKVNILDYEDNGSIALIRLNGGKVNAINSEMLENFSLLIKSINENPNIRAAVMKSDIPGIFCAGADLKERAKMTSDFQVASFVSWARFVLNLFSSIPVPTICALDGKALGGGLEIALACDIRIASDDAQMGLPETKLAIIPGAGGTQRLSRVVGLPRAKQMIYTAALVDGNEAARIGLVNEVVPQNDTRDAAFKRSLQIAMEITKKGPVAIRMAKFAMDVGYDSAIGTAMDIERQAYANVIPTSDRREALAAFAEKRDPKYTGH